jgi:hypothetical protein
VFITVSVKSETKQQTSSLILGCINVNGVRDNTDAQQKPKGTFLMLNKLNLLPFFLF